MLEKVLCLLLAILAVNAQQQIPCGLPPFTSRMPQKQAEQLTQVWANYRNGTPCTAEQKRTTEIIGSLTEEERNAVFDEGQDGIPVEDQFDTTPEFIKSLSPEVRNGFDAIWMDPELTDQDKVSFGSQ
ncbi:hypothetical protein OESDEN_09356 [Oesophagostomum dentatum]|uniref:Uncharacterized protein n=1 Tax=Oesophagostomum dentatum TaxID=61180 RepID=A0A0B1T5W8_OESDE|nr:hypothetical protein OESDEN_09356 [Oesophagostomum dentatum]